MENYLSVLWTFSLAEIEVISNDFLFFSPKLFFFQYVGESLIWVLETGLGDDFTPKLKKAWCDAFAIINSVMLGAIKDING